LGAWGGAGHDRDTITVHQAFEERAKQNRRRAGLREGNRDRKKARAPVFLLAIEAAKSADAVILALGESGSMSGEAGSRA